MNPATKAETDAVRILVLESGYSQESIADAAGIESSAMSRFMSGARGAVAATLKKIKAGISKIKAKEGDQPRCERCRLKTPANELLPAPKWQSIPGKPEFLPVPILGASTTYQPGVIKRMCRQCCVSTIERKRFNTHNHGHGEEAP